MILAVKAPPVSRYLPILIDKNNNATIVNLSPFYIIALEAYPRLEVKSCSVLFCYVAVFNVVALLSYWETHTRERGRKSPG